MPLSSKPRPDTMRQQPRLRALAVILWAGFLGTVLVFITSLWLTRNQALGMHDLTILFLLQWLASSVAAAIAWTLAPKSS